MSTPMNVAPSRGSVGSRASIYRKPVPASSSPSDAVITNGNGHSKENGRAGSSDSDDPIPSNPPALTPREELTPTQAHYLVKALVSLEQHKEWSALGDIGALTTYGSPFSPTANSTLSRNTNGATPPSSNPENIQDATMLRGMFRSHLLTFPGFNTAPNKYFTHHAQPWFDGIASHGLSTTVERGEPTKRMQLNMLFTRLLGSWYARGMQVSVGGGAAATLKQDTAVVLGARERAAINSMFPSASSSPQGWYLGVVESAKVADKLVVGSQKNGAKLTFGSRSFGDFEELNRQVSTMVIQISSVDLNILS